MLWEEKNFKRKRKMPLPVSETVKVEFLDHALSSITFISQLQTLKGSTNALREPVLVSA